MEKLVASQDEISLISVICGAIGIIILALYIIWSSGSQDVPSSVQPGNAVEHVEAVPMPEAGD